MPNQRKRTKLLVSAWIDRSVKEQIALSGMDDTGFIEYSIVRGLLVINKLKTSTVVKLAAQKRIRSETLLRLQNDNLIPK